MFPQRFPNYTTDADGRDMDMVVYADRKVEYFYSEGTKR